MSFLAFLNSSVNHDSRIPASDNLDQQPGAEAQCRAGIELWQANHTQYTGLHEWQHPVTTQPYQDAEDRVLSLWRELMTPYPPAFNMTCSTFFGILRLCQHDHRHTTQRLHRLRTLHKKVTEDPSHDGESNTGSDLVITKSIITVTPMVKDSRTAPPICPLVNNERSWLLGKSEKTQDEQCKPKEMRTAPPVCPLVNNDRSWLLGKSEKTQGEQCMPKEMKVVDEQNEPKDGPVKSQDEQLRSQEGGPWLQAAKLLLLL